jgi:hypothetical protein
MDLVIWFKKNAQKFYQIKSRIFNLQQSKLFISILILLVIGLHSFPVLQGLLGKKQTFWPFMSWSMYRASFSSEEPVRSVIRRIIAITATGKEIDVESAFIKPKKSFFNLFPTSDIDDSAALGLRYFSFERFYIKPIWQGDFSAVLSLGDRLNRIQEVPIVEFRLEKEIHTISDRGIIKEFTLFSSHRITD